MQQKNSIVALTLDEICCPGLAQCILLSVILMILLIIPFVHFLVFLILVLFGLAIFCVSRGQYFDCLEVILIDHQPIIDHGDIPSRLFGTRDVEPFPHSLPSYETNDPVRANQEELVVIGTDAAEGLNTVKVPKLALTRIILLHDRRAVGASARWHLLETITTEEGRRLGPEYVVLHVGKAVECPERLRISYNPPRHLSGVSES